MTKIEKNPHKDNPNLSLEEMYQYLKEKREALFSDPLEALEYYHTLAYFQTHFNYDLQHSEEGKIESMVTHMEYLREYFFELHLCHLHGGNKFDLLRLQEK